MTETKTTKKSYKSKTNEQVSILASIYRYKDKIISIIGIENKHTPVTHKINKKLITKEGWYDIIEELSNKRIYRKDLQNIIQQSIIKNNEVVSLPRMSAESLKSIAGLKHSIEEVTLVGDLSQEAKVNLKEVK